MRKGIFNIAFWILAFAAFVIPTRAAEPYLVHRFNPGGTGVRNNITTILQDSNGFIWIGTQEGLYRYDGNECVKMDIPVNNPGYLSIKDLCEDANHDVWIASTAGLTRYDSSSNKIIAFKSPEFESASHVTKLVRTRNDAIIASARDNGVYHIDTKNYECTPVKLKGADEYYSSSICSTDEGSIYILVRDRGIYIQSSLQPDFRRNWSSN